MLRDVLIIGAIIAVVIILLRLILGAPIIQRIRETFVSGPQITNKYTECPSGSVFYMHGGKAFCCSGNIDHSADTPAGSCKTLLSNASNIFCTLGPTTSDGVVNCIETKAGLAQADQVRYCSPTMPNFAPGWSAHGACCGSVNTDGTDCIAAPKCTVGGDPDLFNNMPGSCELTKAQYDDGACPSGYTFFQTAAPTPTDKVKNIYFCSSPVKAPCYQKGTIERLRAAQYDVSSLTVCPL